MNIEWKDKVLVLKALPRRKGIDCSGTIDAFYALRHAVIGGNVSLAFPSSDRPATVEDFKSRSAYLEIGFSVAPPFR